MTPDEYCQQRTAASGSSFYYSFMFLPPLQRRAITALYAFCREVDDVVDEVTEDRVARLKLDWWRHQVALAFGTAAAAAGGVGRSASCDGAVVHDARAEMEASRSAMAGRFARVMRAM